MYFFAATLLALLPALISAQAAPLNTTILGGGFPTNEFAIQYWRASHSTNVTNAVSFPGYNWSVPITGSTGSTNTSSTWQMHLNYSRVAVPTSSGNATTGLTVFSLTFPERQWNLASDWSLCASTVLEGLAISTAGNNSDSSCAQYIGQGCVDGILRALRGATVSNANAGCPSFPAISSISECSGVTSKLNDIGTAVISNGTYPDLVYNSTNFVSATGGSQVYNRSSVPYVGLSSGQGFAGSLSVLPNGNLDAESRAESQKLHVVALTVVPSAAFRQNTTDVYGYMTNPRLVCARASAVSGASSSIRNAPTAVIVSVAMAVVSLLVL